MAQRVYLIPIRQDLLAVFNRLVLCPASQEEAPWEQIRHYALLQTRLADLSRQQARGLNEKKFEAAGRTTDYYHYSATRPYLITADSAEEAVDAIQTLRRSPNAQAAQAFFDAQVQVLGDLWSPATPNSDEAPDTEAPNTEAEWQDLRKNVQLLKLMRVCHQQNRPVTLEVLRPVTLEEAAIEAFDLDETDSAEVPARQIPQHYGQLLGNTLGRIAGLCEPTWWMGRNYWLGLLCFSRLGFVSRLKYARLQKAIRAQADNPSAVLRDLALPGFEAGFDLTCPAYSTGLLLPQARIPSLLQLLREHRSEWEQLSAHVTGYPGDISANLVAHIEEALLWAQRENCALLEGDELVGSLGYR